ncbi:MAG: hypothetical protein A3E80_03435 [Chlamydiae bacterium RIFCSPHIGHO2_12_FULL_49_9]|nr:MAG: hypothetical protein A3E80_03435 [Chlamydiae bacterium RIFCSPHIGHO2_12_FULL_49_9]
MKSSISSQQAAFFTKNGYIELEAGIDSKEIFAHARALLKKRDPKGLDLYKAGRDLWREDDLLKKALIQKLAPLALALSPRTQVQLAFDQWIPEGLSWDKVCACKDLFSVQGLEIAFILTDTTHSIAKRPPLGIVPLPSNAETILFFRPNLILNWPKLPKDIPLYLGAYAAPDGIYIENPKDPSTNALKSLGYGFGDHLKNETHPLIRNRT